ncbi:uncharacterized protein LOC143288909 [Babylonia areolata]|uniref:uncharacterized protein LOC143288909 n=1 Tax=Babylonia areolata TaxID=304850 RepID=UPI003FD30CAE
MTDFNGTVTCESFPEHPEDCNTVNIVRRVVGAISLISCLFVIVVIWLFGRYSVFAQRLILFLTIAALFNSFGRLFQDSTNEKGIWCTFQAFWLNYFNYAVMLWVVCITFNLFMNVIKSVTTTQYERLYHVVCWVGSLAMSLLPFIGDHYGPSGSWCWIDKDVGWQMGTWYVPLFIVIFTLVIVYGYIVFTMYRMATDWARTYDPDTRQLQQTLKEQIKPLRLYPCVFLLLSIFPLVNRIHNAVSLGGQHELGLVLLHAITASAQGAAYSLIFAIDPDTLRSLTPRQIKVALLRKRSPPVVAQSYQMEVSTTSANAESSEQGARY